MADNHLVNAREMDGRYPQVKRVTLIGVVVNALLALAKVVVGWWGHSQSLIADGVHSLSDLITDALVIWAAKHGSRDADEEHPYGHARIETVITVGLGLFLILIGAGIAFDATRRLFNPELLLTPHFAVLIIAAISILSKEILYIYTLRVAKRIRSNLLKANAWHHRSDAVSSVVVLVGVAGTMAGLPYLDAIAAVGVALMIAKIGWELTWHSLRELVDTALDPETVESIRNAIVAIPDVQALHMLRTRRMGGDALVDVHIQVGPRLSVSEGHQISERVRSKLINQFDEITDVLVHIDPEDDQETTPCCHLPLRDEVIKNLKKHWAHIETARLIEDITLHYLDGRIYVQVQLPLDRLESIQQGQELREQFTRIAKQEKAIASITVQFS